MSLREKLLHLLTLLPPISDELIATNAIWCRETLILILSRLGMFVFFSVSYLTKFEEVGKGGRG